MTGSARSRRRGAAAEPPELDPLIHAPVRLRICAALAATDEAEFGWLLDVLDISKSALSKHTGALVEAGYLAQRRAARDGRQRVWLRLTRHGRMAYETHVAALRAILDTAPAPPSATAAAAADEPASGGVNAPERESSPPAPRSRLAHRSG